MQRGEEPKVDDAINEIAALLAAAYQRRARIRLVRPTLPSRSRQQRDLDNTGEPSPHELTLTGQEKGVSTRS